MNRIAKRINISFLLLFSFILLVGCSKKVTVDDLKKNDWHIESTAEDDASIIASFSNSIITMKIDTTDMKSTAENEWEAIGEELALSFADLIEIKFEYILKGKTITLIDPDTDDESNYVVSRDDKNIIFTPNENSDNYDELDILVLKPLKKESKKKETTESTVPEATAEFNDGSLSSEDFTLTFIESSIIQSPSENKPGLYVQFELTNHSDEPISPNDILNTYIEMEQTTDTSLVTLSNDYFFLDAFGSFEETDIYNEQVERSNARHDMLLPGKTVMVYQGYSLKDEKSPITIIPQLDYKEINPFEIKPSTLKKVKIVEKNQIEENNYEEPVNEPVIDDKPDYIEDTVYDEPVLENMPEEVESLGDEYIELLPGEGPNAVAARAGISVDELFRLNGMTPENFHLSPGQMLKIR